MERQPVSRENAALENPQTERTAKERYENWVRGKSEASARKYNHPYPVDKEKSDFIDWDNPEYAVVPDDPRWVLPPTIDIGASEWYQNLPQDEQIKIGMWRIAQIVMTGAQFEMALNMGIFSHNMNPRNNFEDTRYSHHEAVEESHHIMMFLELIKRMEPEMKRLGIEVDGGPEWFVAASPLVTLVSRKVPVGFWTLVLTGEEPIDRIQRSLRDYDRDLEKQGIEEGRIHPMVRKIMDVHIEEESRHIGYANRYLEERVKLTREDKDAGRDNLSKVQRGLIAATTPLLYKTFAGIILHPSKKSLKSMGIPKEVADETWWNSEQGKKTYYSLFKNAQRRADRFGLRDGEVKNWAGKLGWKICGLVEKEQTQATDLETA